jgi:hypothetical protein
MAEATIIYERTETRVVGENGETEDVVVTVNMAGWPPTTWLVHLDPPLERFSSETGELLDQHEYVALTCKDSEPRAAYLFPATEAGEFVDMTMTPMRTRDYGLPHSVLSQLGYTVNG